MGGLSWIPDILENGQSGGQMFIFGETTLSLRFKERIPELVYYSTFPNLRIIYIEKSSWGHYAAYPHTLHCFSASGAAIPRKCTGSTGWHCLSVAW